MRDSIFHIEGLKFSYLQASWKQFPTDTKSQVYIPVSKLIRLYTLNMCNVIKISPQISHELMCVRHSAQY